MSMMKKLTAALLTVAMTASMAVMSACGDQNGNEEEPSEAESSVADTDTQVSQESSETIEDISAITANPELTKDQLNSLNDFVSQYKKIPKISLQGENIEALGIAKDKKVSFVADNSNFTFTNLVLDQFKTASKIVGLKEVVADESNGTAAFYNSAIEKATKNKDTDLVLLYGDINKDPLATTIETAQANGINIVSGGYVGRDMKDHYVDYTIPIDYNLAGKLLADWAITSNKGKVNALALNNSDSMISTSIYKGFTDEFVSYVSEGYCTVLSGASIEIGNGLSTKIKQALEKDRNLNYIVVLDENMISDAVNAVEQSGKKISIIATGGSTAAFDACEQEKIDVLVAQSYEWTAYAMMDYVLRILGNKTLPEIQSVPVRVVDKDIIQNETKNSEYTEIDGFDEICFGSNFITDYRKMWGLEVDTESSSEDGENGDGGEDYQDYTEETYEDDGGEDDYYYE